jgi:ArsR family transcriptional regulator, arsenate/arsenite/antimonite-responsive transcriptional repressor
MSRRIYRTEPVGQSGQADLASFFRAFSDLTRLRLISLLAGGEVCVCFFVAVIGTNQPKISRHLAYLRKAGVVSSRRRGKWIYYRIANPTHPEKVRLLSEIVAQLTQDPQMRKDREKLKRLQIASNGNPTNPAQSEQISPAV